MNGSASKLIAFIAILALLPGLVSCGDSSSKLPAAQVISVKDAYIRAMPPGQKVTAMFMTLDNHSATQHALLAAKGTVSEAIELHEHKHENGMMTMRQVEKIEIPANGNAALEPGGYHVMLIGLKKNLKPGDKVAIQLLFEDNSTQNIEPEVKMITPK